MAKSSSAPDLLASAGLSRSSRNAARSSESEFSRARAKADTHTSAQPSGGTVAVVQVPEWARYEWLRHGFSTRTGGQSIAYRESGDLNLGFTASDDSENVVANRQQFLHAVGASLDPRPKAQPSGRSSPTLVTLKQIHSSLIRRVDAAPAATAEAIAKPQLQGDGLLTAKKGLLLGIQTADCIPILIADRRNRAVAAIHAGWRGTLGRIVELGVGRMRLEFGSRPEDLTAAIGPGIGACCYAVGEEVRSEFESQFAYAPQLFSEVFDSDPIREKYPMLFLTARAPGHSALGPSLHLDLKEANRRQLLDAGLRPDDVSLIPDCTSCRTDLYFSHRAEHGFTGRMMSVIGIQ